MAKRGVVLGELDRTNQVGLSCTSVCTSQMRLFKKGFTVASSRGKSQAFSLKISDTKMGCDVSIQCTGFMMNTSTYLLKNFKKLHNQCPKYLPLQS